eukprot:GHVN01051162.1.p1 GENE.GHVN01051162.1~~GHVN01051162.1.p1  ORF type:complete len:313 (-),score=48.29 GHVN01051162.1:53-991(-)
MFDWIWGEVEEDQSASIEAKGPSVEQGDAIAPETFSDTKSDETRVEPPSPAANHLPPDPVGDSAGQLPLDAELATSANHLPPWRRKSFGVVRPTPHFPPPPPGANGPIPYLPSSGSPLLLPTLPLAHPVVPEGGPVVGDAGQLVYRPPWLLLPPPPPTHLLPRRKSKPSSPELPPIKKDSESNEKKKRPKAKNTRKSKAGKRGKGSPTPPLEETSSLLLSDVDFTSPTASEVDFSDFDDEACLTMKAASSRVGSFGEGENRSAAKALTERCMFRGADREPYERPSEKRSQQLKQHTGKSSPRWQHQPKGKNT